MLGILELVDGGHNESNTPKAAQNIINEKDKEIIKGLCDKIVRYNREVARNIE